NVAAFDSIYDMVCLAIDPSNPKHVYAGSWGKGLMEFNNRELIGVHNQYNSSLEGFVAALNNVFISGLAFDSKNNLWVANSGSSSILHCRKPDGSWQPYNLGGNASGIDIGKMVIDDYDQKWVLMRKEHSLLVFNETLTQGKPYKILGSATGEGAIPGNMVLSIAVDLDGEIWIGTDAGVAVFYNPDAVFSGYNFDAQRILVEQDGYVQYLLENESVTAIAIDGANRKWIGTDKAGVFLLSTDGTQQIYHFTEDNSPLLSNSVADIAIGKDGEVFIGTSLGIVGFRGDSPSPGPPSDEVYAFPNPVRPSYDGPIGISGLPQNADVKITTISGKLVYHTVAAGTQAVWNGRDFDGRRVQSGVYLVFVSNEDGSEKLITKILFIH
ncbi:MAG TPA: T9SS type A sorting domain-containing protein, partial [Bacteroidales bacterium]|nr:T9SS type A sorting domain-containing protein [Bacteroidales bacterium]